MVSREDFPDDDDGEVLFQLALEGEDLSRKRDIEFYCYARDKTTAMEIIEDLDSYGYESSIYVDRQSEPEKAVSVYSKITMLPTYDMIVLEQKRLNLILRHYDTECDGWMTGSTSR